MEHISLTYAVGCKESHWICLSWISADTGVMASTLPMCLKEKFALLNPFYSQQMRLFYNYVGAASSSAASPTAAFAKFELTWCTYFGTYI